MFKKTRKLLALVLSITMILTAAAGCGSTGGEPAAADSPKATGQNQGNTENPTAQPDTEPTGDSKESSEEGLHKLTQEDVLEIYDPVVKAEYKDDSMTEAVKSGSGKDLELTEEEKEKIRSMNLTVALEQDHLDDSMKLVQQAFRDQCADLNIELKDIWVAPAQDGSSQMEDYQRIEAIAQDYDAIFTCPSDAAMQTEILKKIMKKTKVGFMLAVPFDQDWNDPNFIGITDIDAYQAGVYSAKAAVKINNGKGKIGTIGYINGKNGTINTCYQRYVGWDDVFAENPDVEVVQEWYDDPAESKSVITGLLASNPDISVLLIDWANPPADSAQTAFKELGYEPWKDISMVTIDIDNTITIPMATDGPDNNYTGAFVAQTWYTAGANLIKMYAKHLLAEETGADYPRFVVSSPLPVTVYDNLKTNFTYCMPETVTEIPMPPEIDALENQWDLGVEDIWTKQ